jgi:alpha/beta superfamily hydrolase
MPQGGQNDPGDFLSIQLLNVAARQISASLFHVALQTSRGEIPGLLHPCEGGTGAVVWVSGAIGGLDGPADKLYARLGEGLVAEGITSLRLNYRVPGELDECVLDTLAGVAFLKGIGAERIALVGHSFGGAVVISAGVVSDAVTAVAALSSQTYGATGAAQLSPKPLLLVHGELDAHLAASCSQLIYDWAQEPKKAVFYPGAGHGLRECAGEVTALLQEWLTAQLRAA